MFKFKSSETEIRKREGACPHEPNLQGMEGRARVDACAPFGFGFVGSVNRSRASSAHERAAITGRPVVGPYQTPIFGRARSPSAPQCAVNRNGNGRRGSDPCCFRAAFAKRRRFRVPRRRFSCPAAWRNPKGGGGGLALADEVEARRGADGSRSPTGDPTCRRGAWWREAQIHICRYVRDARRQANYHISA